MPYNSYIVSSEILILDQLIFFFILITCLLDIVLILYEKNYILVTHGSKG